MQAITQRARVLRKKQTKAEELLWQKVRDRHLGCKFVRQKPILVDYFGRKQAFVADFYCHEAKLVVEVDGNVHAKKSDYDSLRTLLLGQKGLRLVRFTNAEVLGDVNGVLGLIWDELGRGTASEDRRLAP